MKKIIITFSLFVFAIAGNSFAQFKGGVNVASGDINFSAGKMKEGVNSITKTGQGTLQFVKKGNSFSEVIFKDEAGTTTKLIPTPAGTGGTLKPENRNKSPETCFGTANKAAGMCVTRSGNIYTVTYYGSGVYKWAATLQ